MPRRRNVNQRTQQREDVGVTSEEQAQSFDLEQELGHVLDGDRIESEPAAAETADATETRARAPLQVLYCEGAVLCDSKFVTNVFTRLASVYVSP